MGVSFRASSVEMLEVDALSKIQNLDFSLSTLQLCGSVAKWLAYWTQAQKGLSSNRICDAVR